MLLNYNLFIIFIKTKKFEFEKFPHGHLESIIN